MTGHPDSVEAVRLQVLDHVRGRRDVHILVVDHHIRARREGLTRMFGLERPDNEVKCVALSFFTNHFDT